MKTKPGRSSGEVDIVWNGGEAQLEGMFDSVVVKHEQESLEAGDALRSRYVASVMAEIERLNKGWHEANKGLLVARLSEEERAEPEAQLAWLDVRGHDPRKTVNATVRLADTCRSDDAIRDLSPGLYPLVLAAPPTEGAQVIKPPSDDQGTEIVPGFSAREGEKP